VIRGLHVLIELCPEVARNINTNISSFFQKFLVKLNEKRELLFDNGMDDTKLSEKDLFKLLRVLSYFKVYSKQIGKSFLNKISGDQSILKNFSFTLENVTSYIDGLDEEEDFAMGNLLTVYGIYNLKQDVSYSASKMLIFHA